MGNRNPDWMHKANNRLGNQNAVGHQKPKDGKLPYGDGCTVNGIHYKCFVNCPFKDDCHYDTANRKMLRKIPTK